MGKLGLMDEVQSGRKKRTSITTPIDAPHEAEAYETAAKEEVPKVTSTEEKKLGRPPKEPTMPLTVRLSPELLHELKLRAVMEHTTQTAIIDTLLRKYLNM
jgi:hypothetical protein